jgi:uncharacterized protein (TIGR02598 family)
MPPMKLRPHKGLPSQGFSLVEVVIATGLCTYALLVVAALLPVGMITFRSANQQIIETEIFNRLSSEFNTTPFYSLQNTSNGVSPLFPTSTSAIYYYFDDEGQDITPSGSNPPPPSGTVYIARCTLVNSQTQTTLESTVPPVDGGASPSGASLTFIQVQIGFHYDPANVASGKTDPRVITRSLLVAKRDTWDGS